MEFYEETARQFEAVTPGVKVHVYGRPADPGPGTGPHH
jgi:hypothetical protein